MNRISNAFKNKKAFIAFITAGDPDIQTTEALVLGMAEAGADLIELGIPFSDPVAEGVVIQRADERALKAGTTVDVVFDLVRRLRKKTDVPLVFLTYANPIFAYGSERFIQKAADAGLDGFIVPDIPFEERDELAPLCRKYGLSLIPLIAPTSHQRIRQIAEQADGFVYCVSSLGVTGVRDNIVTDIKSMVHMVKSAKDIPCAVGFGISTPQQAEHMASMADGAIVGSAIVRIIEEHGRDSLSPVCAYVRSMKEAVMRADMKL